MLLGGMTRTLSLPTKLKDLLKARDLPTDPKEAKKLLPPEEWAKLLSEATGLPFIDPRKDRPEGNVASLVPSAVLQRGTYLPIRREENGEILVAVADPLNSDILRHIRASLRAPVRLAVGPEDAIRQVAARLLEGTSFEPSEEPPETPSVSVEETGTISGAQLTFARIVDMALDRGASDIHFKWAGPRKPLAQFREKGILVSLEEIDPNEAISSETFLSLINVIKNRAGLDLAIRNRPQSGSIAYTSLNGQERRDLRVEIAPSIYGEVAVIRILPPAESVPELSKLGFSDEIRTRLESLVGIPHGLFLVTGPTGSGKSTTLAAIIQEFARKTAKNILTVENPVEYRFGKGIVQVETNERLEDPLTFAKVLRSFLRMDPDVILVGEIRDQETAHIAIEASMTGHLVMGTLHTNDAPSAVGRLENMGIERFKVAEVIRGVLAQRLVPRLCDRCSVPDEDAMEILVQEYRLAPHALSPRKRGPGCPFCRGTGYSGRVALQELFWVNKEIRALLFERTPLEEVVRTARRETGYRPLREDGAEKVGKGLVDLRDMLEATYED